jgi:hypothetical protein
VADVPALLKVVGEREVQEGTAVGDQLHAGAEPALDHGEVARGQVPVQVGHEPPHLELVGGRQAGRVDPRSGHHDHAQVENGLNRRTCPAAGSATI